MKKILVLAVLAAAVSGGAPRTGWDVQGSGLHDRNPHASGMDTSKGPGSFTGVDTSAGINNDVESEGAHGGLVAVATEEMAPITDDLQIADVSDLVEDNSRPTEPTNQPGMHNAGSSKDTFADLSDLVQDNLTESDEITSTENSRGVTGISDDHQVADGRPTESEQNTTHEKIAQSEPSDMPVPYDVATGTGGLLLSMNIGGPAPAGSQGIDDGNGC